MVKTLIALSGPFNCGKSQTLRKVYEMLIWKNNVTKFECESIRQVELTAIFHINEKVRIGITTTGDRPGIVKEKLSLFLKEKCNVIVLATRMRGGTVDTVNNVKNKYDIIWFKKKRDASEREQPQRNLKMAKTMLKKIIKIITG